MNEINRQVLRYMAAVQKLIEWAKHADRYFSTGNSMDANSQAVRELRDILEEIGNE